MSPYSDITRLAQRGDAKGLRPALAATVLPAIIDCISKISRALRFAHQVSHVGTANAFGDEQLNVDVVAEDIIRSQAAQCANIVTLSSEEDPIEKKAGGPAPDKLDEVYTLAFDPLDGSSIIAPNWTVGTIIGVWAGDTALKQQPANQVAAVLGIYGPRTTAVIAIRLPGTDGACFEVGLSDDGQSTTCEVIRDHITLSAPPFKTRYFAPANLRAAAEDAAYMGLVNHYINEKYTLRYSGGLVPDVLHTLVKGHGIYVSPVTKVSKAKLRRLFELAPIALTMECAGGSAIDPATGKRILETAIEDCDERAGLICGTSLEVEKARKLLSLN